MNPFFGGAFFGGGFFQPLEVPMPGGSGRRYPVGNLDLETWRRKHTRLKKRVEVVQEQIQAKRVRIDETESLAALAKLKRDLQALQTRLMELLDEMDRLRKDDEDEAMAVYMAYRRLH